MLSKLIGCLFSKYLHVNRQNACTTLVCYFYFIWKTILDQKMSLMLCNSTLFWESYSHLQRTDIWRAVQWVFFEKLKARVIISVLQQQKLKFKTTFLLSYMAYNVARLHISEGPLIIVVLEKVCWILGIMR